MPTPTVVRVSKRRCRAVTMVQEKSRDLLSKKDQNRRLGQIPGNTNDHGFVTDIEMAEQS
jgi:hypothetical protein